MQEKESMAEGRLGGGGDPRRDGAAEGCHSQTVGMKKIMPLFLSLPLPKFPNIYYPQAAF